MISNVDRCGCCGRYVPKGRDICTACSKKYRISKKARVNAVSDYLQKNHTGREKAITAADIEKELGICHRSFQRYIKENRIKGVPICSGSSGYYFAENQDDVNSTVAWLNSMVTGTSNSRTSLLFADVRKQTGKKKVRKIRIVMEQDGGEDEEISIVVEN